MTEETRYWRWVGAMEGLWQDLGQVMDSYVGRVAVKACAELAMELDGYKAKVEDFPCCGKCDSARLREALAHVRADLTEIRDTEPERRYSPSITVLADTGIAVCDRALR